MDEEHVRCNIELEELFDIRGINVFYHLFYSLCHPTYEVYTK